MRLREPLGFKSVRAYPLLQAVQPGPTRGTICSLPAALPSSLQMRNICFILGICFYSEIKHHKAYRFSFLPTPQGLSTQRGEELNPGPVRSTKTRCVAFMKSDGIVTVAVADFEQELRR